MREYPGGLRYLLLLLNEAPTNTTQIRDYIRQVVLVISTFQYLRVHLNYLVTH